VTHPTRPLFGLDVWRGWKGVDGRIRGHDGFVGFRVGVVGYAAVWGGAGSVLGAA
jgi:hypothetical protein